MVAVIYGSIYKRSLNFLMTILDTGDKIMTKGISEFLSEINNNRDANIESDNYMCQLELKVTLMNIGVKHS